MAHVANNSHSQAVAAAGWRENDQMADFREPFFVEVEWKADAPFSIAEHVRGYVYVHPDATLTAPNFTGKINRL